MRDQRFAYNRRSIRLKGYDYSSPGSYFITICTQGREALLADARCAEQVRYAWLDLTKHFPSVQLDAFVILPNHIHGIVVITPEPEDQGAGGGVQSSPRKPHEVRKTLALNQASETGSRGLPHIVRQFKNQSARRVNGLLGRKGGVWQRNYWEHIIRNEKALQMIRSYIVENPYRWQADRLEGLRTLAGDEKFWERLLDEKRLLIAKD